jgi:hypothetical protein
VALAPECWTSLIALAENAGWHPSTGARTPVDFNGGAPQYIYDHRTAAGQILCSTDARALASAVKRAGERLNESAALAVSMLATSSVIVTEDEITDPVPQVARSLFQEELVLR